MDKRFLLAWFLAFVIWFGGTYVINVYVILEQWFTVPFLRSWEEELKRYHFMVFPFVLYSGVAAWLYRGRSRLGVSWVSQGLAYGALLWLITIVPMRMLNYVTFDGPGAVLVAECLWWLPMVLVVGVVIAWVYRERPAR